MSNKRDELFDEKTRSILIKKEENISDASDTSATSDIMEKKTEIIFNNYKTFQTRKLITLTMLNISAPLSLFLVRSSVYITFSKKKDIRRVIM